MVTSCMCCYSCFCYIWCIHAGWGSFINGELFFALSPPLLMQFYSYTEGSRCRSFFLTYVVYPTLVSRRFSWIISETVWYLERNFSKHRCAVNQKKALHVYPPDVFKFSNLKPSSAGAHPRELLNICWWESLSSPPQLICTTWWGCLSLKGLIQWLLPMEMLPHYMEYFLLVHRLFWWIRSGWDSHFCYKKWQMPCKNKVSM